MKFVMGIHVGSQLTRYCQYSADNRKRKIGLAPVSLQMYNEPTKLLYVKGQTKLSCKGQMKLF